MKYTLAVGTHDPHSFEAGSDDDAVRRAGAHLMSEVAGELRSNPQEVVTLLGPEGPVTPAAERLDEFLRRAGVLSVDQAETLQPGSSGSPDCNGG